MLQWVRTVDKMKFHVSLLMVLVLFRYSIIFKKNSSYNFNLVYCGT